MKAIKLSAEDRELLRQAMHLVQPLKQKGRQNLPFKKNGADPLLFAKRKNAEGSGAASVLSTIHNNRQFFDLEAKHYLQAGYGTDLIRDLKRRKWHIESSLDLHGLNLDQAQTRLDNFLASCLANNIRCVRIIHGKGFGSVSGKSVLKFSVRQHLSRLQSVQAWIEGKERDGGSGAVIALLKTKK